MNSTNGSLQPTWSVSKFSFIFAIYILVVIGAAFLGVKYQEVRQIESIDARLIAAAKGLKYMLADDFHNRAVAANSIGIDEELKNRKALTTFSEEAGFTYVYTLVEKDGNFYFSAPTVTEEEALERERWYFYPYEDIPDSFVKSMREGVVTFSTYTDHWGTFRSVAVPELSPNGNQYLACADMDISYIRAQRLKSFLLAGCAAFVLILTSLPLLIVYRQSSRRYMKNILAKNDQLAEAYAQLQEIDSVKSSLLTKISHELRTPLTSIIGFVKLVARDFDQHFSQLGQGDEKLMAKSERIGGNLSIVIRESERLTRLINDNLDLFKIEAGKMEWRDKRISPASIAQSAIDALQGDAFQKPDVSLNLEISPNLPDIYVDPDKIQQMLLNLLSNAFKFTEHGFVTLSVDRKDAYVRIRVSDSGIGIPHEELGSVFDEFYRSLHDDTVKDIRKGTGLGLAICRQIAEHYGGSIFAESELTQGTTFTVLLKPVEDGDAHS